MPQSHITYSQIAPTHPGIKKLVDALNEYQIGLYGIDQCTLETPEQMENNKAFMVGAFVNDEVRGMGAIKILEDYAEIKRMYVAPDLRGLGAASQIIAQLEAHVWANRELPIRLETGNLHHAAMAFYKKHGYAEIPRFGSYADNEISVCFEKQKG